MIVVPSCAQYFHNLFRPPPVRMLLEYTRPGFFSTCLSFFIMSEEIFCSPFHIRPTGQRDDLLTRVEMQSQKFSHVDQLKGAESRQLKSPRIDKISPAEFTGEWGRVEIYINERSPINMISLIFWNTAITGNAMGILVPVPVFTVYLKPVIKRLF